MASLGKTSGVTDPIPGLDRMKVSTGVSIEPFGLG